MISARISSYPTGLLSKMNRIGLQLGLRCFSANPERVGANTEWGRLREIVVGNASSAQFPPLQPGMQSSMNHEGGSCSLSGGGLLRNVVETLNEGGMLERELGGSIVQQVAFHGQTPSKLFEGAEVIKQVGGRKMGLRCPNVDLRKNLEWSEADIKEIKEKLHAHSGVLTFPNQSIDLSPQDHINFAKHFGETEIHSAVKGIEGYPEVMQIEREPTADIIFGEDFHSDHSFQTWPASYSFLRATNEMTPYGTNNTQFANTIDAYADMSPLMKSILVGLTVSHSATKAYGEADQGETGGHKDNSLYAMKQTKGMELTGNTPIPDQHHPVVISHPLHGEPALFISKTFTNGIVGMTHNEGMELIMLLEKHITQDKYLFEVAYEENQITMWDNRQLVHKGLANDASRRRVIHRVSVSSGHIPVAAKEFDENGSDFETALQAALERKENGAVL